MILIFLFTAAAVLLSFLYLGSARTPATFWRPAHAGDAVIADLGSKVSVDRITAYVGLGTGSYIIELSLDGISWLPPGPGGLCVAQEEWDAVEWRAASLDGLPARWVRVTVEAPGLALGELAVWSGGKAVKPRSVTGIAAASPGGRTASKAEPAAGAASAPAASHPLFDEPASVVFTPSKDTGMYFDEVYFARAGLVIAGGGADPETTHPPLAKLLSALGILLFGPSPFAWRFFFACAGAAAVPAAFVLARRLLGSTGPAAFVGALFLLDFMRVVQSRIATPDAFVLLFTLCALLFMHIALSAGKPPGWLLAAGISLGAAGACKWSGLFAAPALGIFFLVLLRRRTYARDLTAGFLCLIVVPAAVYLAAYAPWLLRGETLAAVVSSQRVMFAYHAGMTQTHPFSSPWWQWPLVIRPVWIYTGAADLPPGMVRSVASFGDPVVWWPAALAVLAAAAAAVRGMWPRRGLRRPYELGGPAAFIALAFVSLYLPWALSPRRLTFLYHFLPCVPFIIIALGWAVGRLADRAPRAGRMISRSYLGLAAALFVAFLPLLYGITIPQGWARLLTWLPTWTFRR